MLLLSFTGVRFLLEIEEPPAQIPTVSSNRGIVRVPAPNKGITRVPSTFGDFEQLFHDVEEFPYPLPPSYGRTDSDKGFYSGNVNKAV